MAAAALIVVAGLVWLLFETAHLRNEINGLRAERAATEQRLDQQAVEQRAHAERLDRQLGEERDRRAQLGAAAFALATSSQASDRAGLPA